MKYKEKIMQELTLKELTIVSGGTSKLGLTSTSVLKINTITLQKSNIVKAPLQLVDVDITNEAPILIAGGETGCLATIF